MRKSPIFLLKKKKNEKGKPKNHSKCFTLFVLLCFVLRNVTDPKAALCKASSLACLPVPEGSEVQLRESASLTSSILRHPGLDLGSHLPYLRLASQMEKNAKPLCLQPKIFSSFWSQINTYLRFRSCSYWILCLLGFWTWEHLKEQNIWERWYLHCICFLVWSFSQIFLQYRWWIISQASLKLFIRRDFATPKSPF